MLVRDSDSNVTTIIHKLLGQQKQPSAGDGKTKPLPGDQLEYPKPAKAIENFDWVYGADRNVGLQRDHNEDALFTFANYLVHQEIEHFTGLFIVADGMGGHVNGELASSLAVRTIAEIVLGGLTKVIFSDEPRLDQTAVKELLVNGLEEANRQVKKQVPGGGTTLTTALIFQDQLMIAHVGDSRAYLIPPVNPIQPLTHDHSLVKQLVELGQLTEEEAAVHPQRNILSMALGQWEPLEPDYVVLNLLPGGHILICSDGLWGVVSEKKIAQIILSSSSPRKASQKLIEAANQAGGPDNITAIVISIPN